MHSHRQDWRSTRTKAYPNAITNTKIRSSDTTNSTNVCEI